MTAIQNLFHKGGSLADLWYKEKERKGRSWEIVQKITHDEYTLDWSISCFCYLWTADVPVRAELLDQFPHIALFITENRHLFPADMPSPFSVCLLPLLLKHMKDISNQVSTQLMFGFPASIGKGFHWLLTFLKTLGYFGSFTIFLLYYGFCSKLHQCFSTGVQWFPRVLHPAGPPVLS